MTVFQWVMTSLWGILYLIFTAVAIKELIINGFRDGNDDENTIVYLWITITFVLILLTTIIAFII